MLQGLLHRNLAQFRRAFAAKGAARSGEHQVGDLLAAPGQALKNGVVFRIHGQDDRAGAGADVAHQTTGQDQGFLVGQTDDLARQGRRQGSGQPGRAHLGRKHGGGFGQGRQLRIALAPYQNARPVSGGKQDGEFFGGGLVQHGQEGRAVALGLGRQALHITGAGQTPHAEEARFGLHHGQGVAPDGAGGAQNHQAARLFPLPALGGRPRNIVDRRTALARPEFCHQSVRINTVVSVALPRPEKNKKMEAPGKR